MLSLPSRGANSGRQLRQAFTKPIWRSRGRFCPAVSVGSRCRNSSRVRHISRQMLRHVRQPWVRLPLGQRRILVTRLLRAASVPVQITDRPRHLFTVSSMLPLRPCSRRVVPEDDGSHGRRAFPLPQPPQRVPDGDNAIPVKWRCLKPVKRRCLNRGSERHCTSPGPPLLLPLGSASPVYRQETHTPAPNLLRIVLRIVSAGGSPSGGCPPAKDKGGR